MKCLLVNITKSVFLQARFLSLAIFIIPLIFLACYVKKESITTPIKIEVQPLDTIYINYNAQSNSFRIGNELIDRTIIIDKKANRIFTSAFINKLSNLNYVNSLGEEFSLRINDLQFSGVTGNIIFDSYQIHSSQDSKGLELKFNLELKDIGTLNLTLLYEIYSHIPVIRKWLEIKNPTSSSVYLDSILTESLNLLPGLDFDIEINDLSKYLKNSKIKGLSPVIFNKNLSEGFVIGNETPGILAYYDIYSKPGRIAIGMTPYVNQYAPRVQLLPNESFTSPAVFLFLFKDNIDQSKELLSDFILAYVAPYEKISYSAFYENISSETTESLLIEKVKQAKNSGADVFCISDDWTDKRGDWTYNKNAYIKNISEYAHSLGMKFGLCVDFAIAETESIILSQYPQWVVKQKNDADYDLDDNKAKLMCLASEYVLYMAYEIDALVKELNLDYVKLTGEILPLKDDGGCYAKDHLHKSNKESLIAIYDGLFAIIQYLHSQNQNLIVDVSLESYNPPGLLDYSLLRYADIDWSF